MLLAILANHPAAVHNRSEAMNAREIALLPPDRHTGLKKLGKRKTSAAGLIGVGIALAHVQEEMGVLDGLKLLAKLKSHAVSVQ